MRKKEHIYFHFRFSPHLNMSNFNVSQLLVEIFSWPSMWNIANTLMAGDGYHEIIKLRWKARECPYALKNIKYLMQLPNLNEASCTKVIPNCKSVPEAQHLKKIFRKSHKTLVPLELFPQFFKSLLSMTTSLIFCFIILMERFRFSQGHREIQSSI